MKHTILGLLGVLGLVVGLGTATAQPVQVETEHSCCLAGEWQLSESPGTVSSDADFCCLADVWQAPAPMPAEPAQADELTCCLADEWRAL